MDSILKRSLAYLLMMCTMLVASVPSMAQDDIEEIKRQLEILTEEIENLKLGEVAEPEYKSFSGLGPAASKVYGVDSGLSIGGYGEAVYLNYSDSSKKDMADVYRFILYTGYKFNEKVIMNSELEIEHAGISNVDDSRKAEVYVEFMYIDLLLARSSNIRTGLILMPIGFISEFHEPTVYNGVLRPDIATNIFPTTWRELGVMLHGEHKGLAYKFAITTGLRADLFKGSSWIKGGRQKGAKVNADVAAFIGNVNYSFAPWFTAGGTYYISGADSGKGGSEDVAGEKKGTVRLWEVHAEANLKGAKLRWLYTRGSLSANSALKATSVGKKVRGWYVEGAYDVAGLIRPGTEMSFTPFVRYERYDTNDEVFTGVRDKRFDREVLTVGVGFKPHPNVIFKVDYQWHDTASDLPAGKRTGEDEYKIDQFNLGVGFIF